MGSGVRGAIARRELASLGREKTIVLALLIQLFIAAFSSFLVVGLTSLYDPGSVEAGEVRVGVTGELQDRLLAATERQRGIEGVGFSERGAAMSAFDDGRVDAVLTGTRVPGPGGGSRLDLIATVPDEDLRTTLIVVRLRQLLTALESAERESRSSNLEFRPIDPPAGADASPYFGFTYTILIPLLAFLPPFISGSVAVDTVTEEIERGTLELLRVAPVGLVDIVDGKGAAMVLLAPLQVGLWIVLLTINDIAVANVAPLLMLVAAVATVVVVVGVVLGLATGRRRQAQLLYSVLVIGLFGAGALLPEHPATTVAKLAVDSPTGTTFAQVAGFALVAVGLAWLARRYVGRLDPADL